MKRTILVMLMLVFALSALAVDVQNTPYLAGEKSAKVSKANDGRDEMHLNRPIIVAPSVKNSDANLPGTKVGETAYNYQTNDNLHDRIVYDKATGTVHVQWMYGDISETSIGFPGRRMYYNYFDGANWLPGLGVAIETSRAGYGSLAVDNSNIAIPASHHTLTNEEATNVWYDFLPGMGFFTQSNVYEARSTTNPALEPFWPDIAVDDADVWYVTATNNNQDDWVDLVNDVNDNILFWRSTDRGMSWSETRAMFPDTTTYPLGSGASGPSEAGSHQVAVSDNGNGKVGVLVADAGHDFYFFESEDRGVTFKDGIKIIGNNFPDESDSLTYPVLWDIAISDSSEFGGEVDTFLTVFTGSTNDETGMTDIEPNIRPRPIGPADLIYINGEAHIVWNELMMTASGSYYPNGYGRYWTNPAYSYLGGATEHMEGGFAIKHWSAATGISTIFKEDDTNDVTAGTFQHFVTMPQIGMDDSGNLYCLFTKISETDTLVAEDNLDQSDTTFGPLGYGRIWGAKSDDNGATWYDASQLISEDDCFHENQRYIGVADYNGADAVNIVYQNTSGHVGVPIGEGADHNVWTNADIYHWAVPTSAFATTKTPFGPEIELVTSSIYGGLDFGDIGDVGTMEKPLIVKNLGDQDLVVSGIFSGDRSVTASPASFTVAPGGQQEVIVTFRPRSEEMVETYLAIPNNDPSEPAVGIPVDGIGLPTSVEDRVANVPVQFNLAQNYPNPFNPTTTVNFDVAKTGHVKISVYNTLGKEIDVLVDQDMTAGSHEITWNAHNVSSGVYFYNMTSGDFSATKKMIVLQ